MVEPSIVKENHTEGMIICVPNCNHAERLGWSYKEPTETSLLGTYWEVLLQ